MTSDGTKTDWTCDGTEVWIVGTWDFDYLLATKPDKATMDDAVFVRHEGPNSRCLVKNLPGVAEGTYPADLWDEPVPFNPNMYANNAIYEDCAGGKPMIVSDAEDDAAV